MASNGDVDDIRLEEAIAIAPVLQTVAADAAVVLLALDNGPALCRLIVACLAAGLPFCVLHPDDREFDEGRLAQEIFGARRQIVAVHDGSRERFDTEGVRWLPVERLRPSDSAPSESGREPRRADVVYFQLTSGTTGRKKAVAITGSMLRRNLDDIAQRMNLSRQDRFSIWVPLSHDMGLATFLQAVRLGCFISIMSPDDFIRNPLSSLTDIAKNRATFTSAPGFSLRLLSRLSRARERTFDLSSLRRFAVGAESIFSAHVTEFQSLFAPCDLRRDCVRPSFGMAEAVVCLTATADDEPVRHLSLLGSAATVGQMAIPAESGIPGSVTYVSNGRPLDGVDLMIGDENDRPLPEMTVGHIRVRGENVATGYVGCEPDLVEGWRETGDLGFLHQGELYVSGRAKDIVVRNGVNYCASDLEASVTENLGREARRVAVISRLNLRRSREEVIVAVESRSDEADIAPRVRHILMERHGFAPDRIVRFPPRTLPMSTSGKIRRKALRDMWEDLTDEA